MTKDEMYWKMKKEMAKPFEEKVIYSQNLVKEAIEKFGNRCCVAFSGGKDSEVALNMAIKVKPDILVAFNNTGVQFAETYKFIRMLKNDWHLNLIELHPWRKNFWQCAKEYGLPKFKSGVNQGARCCHFLKEKPFQIFCEKKGIKCIIDGLMCTESRNRYFVIKNRGDFYHYKDENLPFGNIKRIYRCHPIAYWNDDEVWEYIKDYARIPYNEVYDKWNKVYHRSGCKTCTAYVDWQRKLKLSHPKLHKFMLDMWHQQQNDGQKQITDFMEAIV